MKESNKVNDPGGMIIKPVHDEQKKHQHRKKKQAYIFVQKFRMKNKLYHVIPAFDFIVLGGYGSMIFR
ncbi:hypothetical protein [Paenibacillus dendritiformis]|uniref:hypothetical protein n=1 Tax=Paenibacillus dendritiformis TaxID=130049 RepID=UPI00387E183F